MSNEIAERLLSLGLRAAVLRVVGDVDERADVIRRPVDHILPEEVRHVEENRLREQQKWIVGDEVFDARELEMRRVGRIDARVVPALVLLAQLTAYDLRKKKYGRAEALILLLLRIAAQVQLVRLLGGRRRDCARYVRRGGRRGPGERGLDGHVEGARDPADVVRVLNVGAREVSRTEAGHGLANVLLRAEHGDEHEQENDRVLAVEAVDKVIAAARAILRDYELC